MTNRILFEKHTTITILRMQESPLLEDIQPCLNDFYKTYGGKIGAINERLLRLQKSFFVFEEDKMKTEIIEEGKPQLRAVLQEGKTQEDYDKLKNEFLDQQAGTPLITI